jgi:hypothetical protein
LAQRTAGASGGPIRQELTVAPFLMPRWSDAATFGSFLERPAQSLIDRSRHTFRVPAGGRLERIVGTGLSASRPFSEQLGKLLQPLAFDPSRSTKAVPAFWHSGENIGGSPLKRLSLVLRAIQKNALKSDQSASEKVPAILTPGGNSISKAKPTCANCSLRLSPFSFFTQVFGRIRNEARQLRIGNHHSAKAFDDL